MMKEENSDDIDVKSFKRENSDDIDVKSSKRAKFTTTTDTTQAERDSQLVKMFCKDLGPQHILGYNGFQEFITNNIPNYTLPSLKEFSGKLIPEEYNRKRFIFTKFLKSVNYVAVSMDTWKLPGTDRRCAYSLWTATIHFVHQGKLVSHNLFTIDANSRSEHKIAKSIKAELEDKWEVLNKVVCFITNDGKNEQLLKKAVIDILKLPHVSCIAANINRFVEETLGTLRSRGFEKQYNKKKSDSSNPLKKKEEPFSWHYLYNMLKDISENNAGEFDADQRGVWGEYLKILKPLIDLTNTLSSQKYLTLSNIIPLLADVRSQISECSVSTDSGLEFKKKLDDWSIKTTNTYKKETVAENATFMDPRFTKSDNVQSRVINEFNMYLNSVNTETLTNKLSSAYEYVHTTPLERNEDPFHFWEEFNRTYKDSPVNFSVMAQKYLCIPATVTPVETVSGEILWKENDVTNNTNYNERRTELELKNISKVLFLYSYYTEMQN